MGLFLRRRRWGDDNQGCDDGNCVDGETDVGSERMGNAAIVIVILVGFSSSLLLG